MVGPEWDKCPSFYIGQILQKKLRHIGVDALSIGHRGSGAEAYQAKRGPSGHAISDMRGIAAFGSWLLFFASGVGEFAKQETVAQIPEGVNSNDRESFNYDSSGIIRMLFQLSRAQPGDYLVVVDRATAALPVRSGDFIIVTRAKDGLCEVTARQILGSAPDYELG